MSNEKKGHSSKDQNQDNKNSRESLTVNKDQNQAQMSSSLLQGTFESTARGSGFVTVEGMDEDLFIPQMKTGGAFYGDTVEVRLLPNFQGDMASEGRNGRRREAEVVRVLRHGISKLVGTFERGDRSGIVTPDNRKIPSEIYINRQDTMGAVDGHKVVVEMTHYGSINRNPEGRIVEILGHMDDPGVDILSIIRAYDLPGDFPEAVKEEVRTLPQEVKLSRSHVSRRDADQSPAQSHTEGGTAEPIHLESELSTVNVNRGSHPTAEVFFSPDGPREDWRKVPIVTIDGPDTKDIDDAISVEKTDTGWRLGVHIADVSEYVKEGSPLDQEALERATSNYLVDRVIPMLPHELSNGICSLNQGVDRLALSCVMELDQAGNVLNYYVAETVIHSAAKLSYPGVMKLFRDGDDSEIRQAMAMQGITESTRGYKTKLRRIDELLLEGRKLAAVLEKRRAARGSIDFDFKESEIILDRDGHPTDIVEHERNDATMMIEDFMILANETVASMGCWLGLPFVFRTHAKPAPEKIQALRSFIRNYGYQLKGKDEDMHPRELRSLLEKLDGKPEEAMISTMTLRSMQRACYTTDCGGHFGLALRYYCHFTSPIRRYPDLQIHRIIKEYLHGQLDEKRRAHYEEILTGVCKQSSDRERRADEAERETDKQKKAEYMKERIGQEFEGVVSGVTGWGMYVALENTVEGLVPVGEMRSDYFDYDEEHMQLVGEHSHKAYTLGDRVQVVCSAVDVVNRTIDFVLAEDFGKPSRKGKYADARNHSGGKNGSGSGKGFSKDASSKGKDTKKKRWHRQRRKMRSK